MDRKKTDKLMKLFNEDSSFKLKNGKTIQFARCNNEDVKRIEAMTNEELMDTYKSISIGLEYGVSLRDMEFLSLLEMEMTTRKIPDNKINKMVNYINKTRDKIAKQMD